MRILFKYKNTVEEIKETNMPYSIISYDILPEDEPKVGDNIELKKFITKDDYKTIEGSITSRSMSYVTFKKETPTVRKEFFIKRINK